MHFFFFLISNTWCMRMCKSMGGACRGVWFRPAIHVPTKRAESGMRQKPHYTIGSHTICIMVRIKELIVPATHVPAHLFHTWYSSCIYIYIYKLPGRQLTSRPGWELVGGTATIFCSVTVFWEATAVRSLTVRAASTASDAYFANSSQIRSSLIFSTGGGSAPSFPLFAEGLSRVLEDPDWSLLIVFVHQEEYHYSVNWV